MARSAARSTGTIYGLVCLSRFGTAGQSVCRPLPHKEKVALMSNFSVRLFAFGAICAALASGTSAANAQVLDPNAYTSDGVLSLASGTYTLDTDALTFAGNSGVLSNGIAVFDFSSINVSPNATVNVIGSHPLALLSQSDAVFGAGSSFNLNGGNGGNGVSIAVLGPPS